MSCQLHGNGCTGDWQSNMHFPWAAIVSWVIANKNLQGYEWLWFCKCRDPSGPSPPSVKEEGNPEFPTKSQQQFQQSFHFWSERHCESARRRNIPQSLVSLSNARKGERTGGRTGRLLISSLSCPPLLPPFFLWPSRNRRYYSQQIVPQKWQIIKITKFVHRERFRNRSWLTRYDNASYAPLAPSMRLCVQPNGDVRLSPSPSFASLPASISISGNTCDKILFPVHILRAVPQILYYKFRG